MPLSPQQNHTAQANIRFLQDPRTFMQDTLIDSVSVLERSIGQTTRGQNLGDLADNNQAIFDFHLVPLHYGKVGLEMSLRGSRSIPGIPARYLGFNFNVSGPGQMGKIDVAGGDTDFIFTVGITGCTIIGVRNGGQLTFYHEPTRDNARGQWLDRYPGDVVLYAPSSTGYGTAVMHRYDGRHWRVYMQSFDFAQGDWAAASARDASSSGGTESSRMYNFYSFTNLEVFDEV
ncbi:MAG: hypothetical protein AAGF11_50295 [Myxococcota bacterium]